MSVLEVQIYDQSKGKFWRKVEVGHSGWKCVTLPLRWFRWGSDRVPRWDQVDRLGFWFRDAAQLSIDTIYVSDRRADRGAFFRADELRQLAFPDSDEDAIRIVEQEHLVLISDAQDLDAARLARHLQTVAAAVAEDLPFLDAPPRPPTMLIFSTPSAYRRFVPRFAQQFNSRGAPPRSSGYTLHGVATSYWDDQYGTLRPVFTHEFVHSYLAASARQVNKGEWLHEGLASKYQLRFHPQADIGRIVQAGLERSALRSPLEKLCSGGAIPTNRYWQAMTVIEMLMSQPHYAKRLPDLFDAFYRTGSTDLGRQLRPVLETDWQAFQRDWREFCQTQYVQTAAP